jgi:hypothetical protein
LAIILWNFFLNSLFVFLYLLNRFLSLISCSNLEFRLYFYLLFAKSIWSSFCCCFFASFFNLILRYMYYGNLERWEIVFKIKIVHYFFTMLKKLWNFR